ncbi:hypothetical protein V2J09_020681 [Rumex salicifolius]
MTRVRTPLIYFYLYIFSATLALRGNSDQESTYNSGKAKFYQMPDDLGTPSGACGYGEYGRSVYNGNVAAVSSRSLYRSGAGCGTCFQVKCKAPECNDEGVNVVLTDNATSDEAEFILSSHAFIAMAIPGKEKEVKEYGVVEIEYERISCDYGGGKNLMLKVLDYSSNPYYLAFLFLNQGGISSITAVEIFEEEEIEWKACRRSYGAVWEISSLPMTGKALTLRLFLPGAPKWMLLPKVIPSSWKPGVVYDTSVQISSSQII